MKRAVNLKELPSGWNDCSLKELQQINTLQGKYRSKEAYLTHCLFALLGIVPLCYNRRWREFLSLIPLFGRLIRQNGRQIDTVYDDFLGIGEPFISYKSRYRRRGFWNFLFGRRFWISDDMILSMAKQLEWLNTPPNFITNPIAEKKICMIRYRSVDTRFADMPWYRYNQCCTFIEVYERTHSREYLNRFIASLYNIEKPEKVEGNFSEFEIGLIIIFWNSVQKNLMNTFPRLYKSKKKSDTPKKTDYMKNAAQITVFLAKQSNSLPKDVQEMETFYALEYMERNAEEVEERERQMRNIKRKK